MKKRSFFIVLVLFLSAFCLSEAKPVKTGVHNYLGKDGQWHYVTTYKDSKSGHEWSSEWVNGDGPNIYGGRTLPSFNLVGSDSTGGGSAYDIHLNQPCEIACEFKAFDNGSLEIKVDVDVEVEILKLNDASVFFNRTQVSGQPYFQQILIPNYLYSPMPYGLIVYKDGAPKYMELFFFDGSLHNSMEEFSSPGYDAEIPPPTD